MKKINTGEALKNEEISVESEYIESHNKEEKLKLLEESKEALESIASADPKDATDAFLLDYFSSRKWEEKQKKPSAEELKADDDLEDIDDAIEFEERYNFRHEEVDFDKISRAPRYVPGEDRVRGSKRKQKRQEEAIKAKELEEQYQKRLDEIDEKYKKIAEKNNGRLTKEQLHQYTNECADVLLEEQEMPFNYTEGKPEGGIEKAINIMKADDDDEEESDDESENENNDGDENSSKPNKDHKEGLNKKWDKGPKFNQKNRFNHGKHGKFDRNRKNKFKGVSSSRLNAYKSHKH